MNDRPKSSSAPLIVALVAVALGLPCIGGILLAVGLFFLRVSAVPAPAWPVPVQSMAVPATLPAQAAEQEPAPLLGARGPLTEKVGELAGKVEVIGADVTDELETPNTDQPPGQRILPTGTNVLRIWLDLSKSLPDRITLAVFNDAGQVPIGIATSETTDGFTGKVSVANRCAAQGSLPDGAYQARLKMGDQEFLRINWHIGVPAE